MSRESLASIKRRLTDAVSALKKDGTPLSVQRLSRDIGMSRDRLDHMLCYVVPQWRVDLEIPDRQTIHWNLEQRFEQYRFAASLARNNNEMPTATNLSELLSMNRQVVMRFMSRFPEFASEIHLCTEAENAIYKAGRMIRLRGAPVTMRAIAEESGYTYNWVRKVINDHPEFVPLIALDKNRMPAERNRRIADARRKRAETPQKPMWVQGTIELPRLTARPDATIAAKIIASVSMRHRVHPQDFFRKQTPASKLSVLQNLAGYLLMCDAGLSAEQVGNVLGNRSKKQVEDGRRMILRHLRQECAQAELAVLRKIYLEA